MSEISDQLGQSSCPEGLKIVETIINTSPAIVFLWRAEKDWPVEFVSESISRFGYTPEDFTSGRLIYAQIIHAKDLERVAAEIAQYCEEGRNEFTQEYRILAKSGQVCWLDGRTQVRRDESGAITHYQGIVIDITERRRLRQTLWEARAELGQRVQERTAELDKANADLILEISERKRVGEALRESEEKYRTLVENISETIFALDAQGNFNYISPTIERFSQFSVEEVIGQPFIRFVHPDDLPGLQASFKRTIKGAVEPFEFRVFAKDGTIRHVLTSSRLVWEAGGAAGLIGILSDITERKQAEQALRESEDRWRRLVEYNPACLAVHSEGKVIYANKATLELVGASNSEQVLGKAVLDFVHPDFRDIVRARASQMLADDRPVEALQEKYLRLDGSVLDVEVTAIPITYLGKRAIMTVNWDITERKRAEGVREAIYKISQAANSIEDLEDLYRSIHLVLGEFIPAKYFYIALYDPSSDMLSYPYYVDPIDTPPAPEKVGRGLTGYVLRTGQALLASPEIFNTLVEQGEVEAVGAPSIDWLGVPLRVEGKITGVMAVQSYSEKVRFGEKELRLMEFVSSQVAMAIERKQTMLEKLRLLEETQRHLQRLNALHRIDRAINASLDLNVICEVLLDQVLSQLRADAADILLLDNSTQTLVCVSARGFRSQPTQRTNLHLSERYIGRMVLERVPVYIPDLGKSGERDPSLELPGEELAAYFGVPIIAKGQIKGILEVFHRTPLQPEREWLDFLGVLAAQAAIAIDNTSMFDALQRSNQELIVAYDATLEGWSHALELRDQETEGHTRRVTDLTCQLARQMGFSDAELVHVRRGAMLHDIGKVGIPDSILLKPGPLSDDEWAIMHKHPVYAFELLYPIPYLRPALDIPYRHHEKWDGTGYPRRLRGEKIPLAARIFAVVDVWDALTSNRIYRHAWSEEEALEYIRSQAGRHFDPRIVDIFLSLISKS